MGYNYSSIPNLPSIRSINSLCSDKSDSFEKKSKYNVLIDSNGDIQIIGQG